MSRLVAFFVSLLGVLVATVAITGSVAVADEVVAPSIPPTPECTKTFKKLFGEYADKVRGSESEDVEEAANRELTLALVDAGCLSDSEPILNEVKARPFSKKCLSAGSAAEKYWQGPTRRINAVWARYSNRLEVNRARSARLLRRLVKLYRQDGSAARQRALRLRLNRLEAARTRMIKSRGREVTRIVWPHAYQNYLTLGELLSLRCIGAVIISPPKSQGPAERAFMRNVRLLYFSTTSVLRHELRGTRASSLRSAPLS